MKRTAYLKSLKYSIRTSKSNAAATKQTPYDIKVATVNFIRSSSRSTAASSESRYLQHSLDAAPRDLEEILMAQGKKRMNSSQMAAIVEDREDIVEDSVVKRPCG